MRGDRGGGDGLVRRFAQKQWRGVNKQWRGVNELEFRNVYSVESIQQKRARDREMMRERGRGRGRKKKVAGASGGGRDQASRGSAWRRGNLVIGTFIGPIVLW